MKKRLLSLILALILICALLPQTLPKAHAVGGTCGANTTWTFDTDTGVLTIQGTGSTSDWTHWDNLPWAVYRTKIKTVRISSGVTRLGNQAFINCTGITGVSFPSTLTEIGEACFRYDNLITTLNLPAQLKKIGRDAFMYCSGLQSVTIPASVTSIGICAFGACTKLRTIKVESGNSVYAGYGNCLYNRALTVLHQVPAGLTGSFEVPVGVGSIDPYGFYHCDKLTEITLPASVSVIGQSCFHFCSALERIDIPANVKRIEPYTFYSCSMLASVTLPSGLNLIRDRAFSCCYKLKNLTLPAGLTEIGEEAFSYDYLLTEVTIPAQVTTLGRSPFGYCTGLYRFAVDTNNTAFSTDSYGVLFNKDKTTLVQCPANKAVSYKVPSTVKTIAAGAFYGCVNLPGVTLPDGLTTIRDGAFSCCKKLGSVTVPTTVTRLESGIFINCEKLSSAIIPNSVVTIGANVFKGCASGMNIYGATGSAAETYAADNGINFVSNLRIAAHPVSISVKKGETAAFRTTGYSGVEYQWQYKKVGQSDWTDWDGKCSATVTCTAGVSNNGCKYRCVVSNECGVLISNVATLTTLFPPSITAQPQNTAVAKGKTATFRVTASGDGLSYQWQYKKVGESGWTNWAGKTQATVTCTAGTANDGCLYRCVVQNYVGSVTSNTAALTTVFHAPAVTAQPRNTSVAKGKTATFQVTASGEGLSYQWQYKKVGESGWTNWAGKTQATVTCTAGAANDGCLYRCIVKNALGSVTTSNAKLTTVYPPTITAQPKNTAVAKGSTASFTVTASGIGLSYQWQYKKVGESGWTNWAGKTAATVTCTAGAANDGCLYRCMVKNSAGSVTSSVAVLTTVFNAPKITTQPKNTSVKKGSTATFKVVATGEALSYQWQYKKVGETSWTNWAGKTSATVSCTAGVSNNGCQYRCVVKNAKGSVTSTVAKLTTLDP